MSTAEYLLVFDAGTGSGRCLLFDRAGHRLVRLACAWEYDKVTGDRLTFTPQAWWDRLATLCRQVLAGVDPAQIAAVSATSQRQGLIALGDENNELFGWPNLDRSVRLRLTEDKADEVYNLAGRWPGSIHAGLRLMSAPEVVSFLPISDWILYRLTGVVGTEPTQAAETCLFDIHTGQWSMQTAALFDQAERQRPPLRLSGDYLGDISPEAAQQTGLLPGTPVIVGGADTPCGTLGAGAGFLGRIGLVAGTSAPLTVTLDQPHLDSQRRTITSPNLWPGSWLLESNAFFTGLSYAKLRDLLLPGRSYAEIDRELDEFPTWTGAPVYLGASIMNSRGGSLLPWGGLLTRLPLTELSPRLLLRSALESAACAIRANLEQLGDIVDDFLDPAAPIYMGGGASHSLWAQMVADICQRPLLIASEREVSALGAAMIAATAVGFYPDLAAAATAMNRPAITRYPQAIPDLESHYQRWLAGYYAMVELGREMRMGDRE